MIALNCITRRLVHFILGIASCTISSGCNYGDGTECAKTEAQLKRLTHSEWWAQSESVIDSTCLKFVEYSTCKNVDRKVLFAFVGTLFGNRRYSQVRTVLGGIAQNGHSRLVDTLLLVLADWKLLDTASARSRLSEFVRIYRADAAQRSARDSDIDKTIVLALLVLHRDWNHDPDTLLIGSIRLQLTDQQRRMYERFGSTAQAIVEAYCPG